MSDACEARIPQRFEQNKGAFYTHVGLTETPDERYYTRRYTAMKTAAIE
jgi:hypothetical protein